MKITGVHVWRGTSHSVDRTLAIGAAVGRLCRAGDTAALRGELGAGKTQLVRGIAQGMGVAANVASPTYVLMHEYPAPSGGPVLVHIDAYRLRDAADLESIGWGPPDQSDLRRGAVVAVEWAEKLEDTLGDDVLEVEIAHAGESSRAITITPRGRWVARMAALRQALD
jgi:tRNA threonylcarbamoyladenosine biosynthesis protein TsaE